MTADVDATTADAAIEKLEDFGIESNDLTLWRVPGIQPLDWRRGARSSDSDAQVWAEIVGRASENAELASTYLVFMVTAGIIAGIGVLTASSMLLVGAMAISPDLLPVLASAIGIVERRWHLTVRALRALVIGLGAGALGALTASRTDSLPPAARGAAPTRPQRNAR